MSDASIDALLQAAREYWRAGRPAEAEPLLAQILGRDANNVEALHLLGVSLAQLKKIPEAEGALRQALRLQPEHTSSLNDLGAILARNARPREAIEFLARASVLKPSDHRALLNLANAYFAVEQFADSIPTYRRCIALSGEIPEAHRNLALALRAVGELDEAVDHFNQALLLDPDKLDALSDLVATLRQLGRANDAEATCRRAVADKPAAGEGHWNLALLLLLRGEFEEGWREYDWRGAIRESGLYRLRMQHPRLAEPKWDGSHSAGKRLYIYSEQGYGDTIQFVRYLPMVRQTGARIFLGCQSALIPLLKNMEGVEQYGHVSQPPPPFDAHCPLMSLPLIFKTELDTIPAEAPYLGSDGAKWRSRLEGHRGRKIGLAWAGRRLPDPKRSIPAHQLMALADVGDVQWISLQKDKTDAGTPPLSMTDWTAELNDFADTADLIANLDLVITIDTSVAHLAGAMGKPVWVLLPKVGNWRWLLDRSDSPWYPTMRLFRQTTTGDWHTPLERIAEELK